MAKPSKSKSQTKSQSLRPKGSRLRSEVWKHFDKVTFNGEEKAICHGCGKEFVGSGKKGTSHLKTHWGERCSKRNSRNVELNVMDLRPKVAEGGEITSINSDQSNAILRGYKEDKENFCSYKQILDMTVEKSAFKSLDNKSTGQVIPRHSVSKFGVVLENLVRFKETFCKLEQEDIEFKSLTEEEWDGAIAICEFLKGLYDVAPYFSSKGLMTPNVCFSKFCDQLMKLFEAEKSDNCYIRELGSTLKPTFLNLWKESLLVLTITVMLDPRFKMEIVYRWFIQLYGGESEVIFNQIFTDVTEVYNKYARDFRIFGSSLSSSGDVSLSTSYKMLDDLGRPYTRSTDDVGLSSSELERYLKDSKFYQVEEFDILAWWRVNAQNYPILAIMARDFLAVPISDFYFASTIEIEIEKIVQNTQYLHPDVREALICTNNQLETPPDVSMVQDQTMEDNDLTIEKVVMSQNHPVPPIETRWSKYHDASAEGWAVAYTNRIQQFKRFNPTNEKTVINLE